MKMKRKKGRHVFCFVSSGLVQPLVSFEWREVLQQQPHTGGQGPLPGVCDSCRQNLSAGGKGSRHLEDEYSQRRCQNPG